MSDPTTDSVEADAGAPPAFPTPVRIELHFDADDQARALTPKHQLRPRTKRVVMHMSDGSMAVAECCLECGSPVQPQTA